MATFNDARDRAATLVRRTGKAHLALVSDIRQAAPWGTGTILRSGYIYFDPDGPRWIAHDVHDAILFKRWQDQYNQRGSHHAR